jgi:hypothetical protein
MKNNQVFQKNSFGLLANQYIRVHGRDFLLTIGVAIIAIGAIHMFLHQEGYSSGGSKLPAIRSYHWRFFFLAFAGGSLLWCGSAFQELRSKERKIMYLMLPAGMFQKFFWEFIVRLVLYILLFPLIYWSASNLVGILFHSEHQCLIHYGFKFEYIYANQYMLEGKMLFSSALFFLLFTLPFAGATYFEKLPLPKTILSLFVLVGLYVGYTWIVFVYLGLKNYSTNNTWLPFLENADSGMFWATISLTIVHLTLLAITYFKLKEKEV